MQVWGNPLKWDICIYVLSFRPTYLAADQPAGATIPAKAKATQKQQLSPQGVKAPCADKLWLSSTSPLHSPQDCWSRQGPFTRGSTQNWTVRVKCCETLWYCSVAVTTDTAWVVFLLCFSGIFLKTDLRYRRELVKKHWCISQLFTVTDFCSSFRDLKHSLEQKIRCPLWIHPWI